MGLGSEIRNTLGDEIFIYANICNDTLLEISLLKAQYEFLFSGCS